MDQKESEGGRFVAGNLVAFLFHLRDELRPLCERVSYAVSGRITILTFDRAMQLMEYQNSGRFVRHPTPDPNPQKKNPADPNNTSRDQVVPVISSLFVQDLRLGQCPIVVGYRSGIS